MKKFYSFIAFMMLCLVGTANAQTAYEPSSESVEAIQPGVKYALQEGDNTSKNAEGQDVKGSHSKSLYMVNNNGSVGMQENVTEASLVYFVGAGENSHGTQVYVMQSVATKKYLTQDGFTSDTKAQAYKFSISRARAVSESGEDNGGAATWEQYHDIVSNTRSIYAEANNAWVLCAAESKNYIGFVGDGFSFMNYIDTNNWYVKTVTEQTVPAQDQLGEFLSKYFSNGIDPAFYIVGTTPGCISESLFNDLNNAFNHATELLGGESDEEECLQAIQTLKDLIARYDKEIIKVTPGYYVFKNVGGRGIMTVTDDKKGARGNTFGLGGDDYNNWTPEAVTSWNLNNAKMIWQVEKAEEDGKILLKNFATQQYLTFQKDYVMTEEDGTAFVAKAAKGVEHVFTFGTNGMVHVANHSNNKLLNYNDVNDAASRWLIYTVNQDTINKMLDQVNQGAMNQKLQALVDEANSGLASVKYENGFVEGGFYNYPADSGLVTSFMEVNSFATNEGKNCTKEAPFDGKADTYFHTAWGAGDVTAQNTQGSHWVKFDLGSEVSHLVIKFTKRKGAVNSHINSYTLSTIADESELEDPKTVWTKKLVESPDSIMYQFGDSTTHIAHYDFKEKVRYILFDVTSTRGKHVGSFDAMAAGTGPYWHCSEMRMYDADSCVVNPQFLKVDKAVQDRLNNAIAAANKELKDRKAQQATFDELEAALKAYWEAYPDPASLLNRLEVAKEMIEKAVEGPDMAQFEEGARAELQKVVEQISKEIEGKALTFAEIKKYEKQLEDAIALFNSKLRVPQAGKLYRIMGSKPFNPNSTGEDKQWSSYAYAQTSDLTGTPKWGYPGDANLRHNTLWLVEHDDKGFTFKNMANGLYLQNPYDGLTEEQYDSIDTQAIGFSQKPQHFQLEATTTGKGSFLIVFKKDSYMNFDPIGNVVHYYDRNDDHALFTFAEVTEDNFEFAGTIDIPSGKFQVVSAPFDIESYAPEDAMSVYKVLGKSGDKILLTEVADDEPISAGTPVLFYSDKVVDEKNNVVSVGLPFYYSMELGLEDMADMKFDFTAKEETGLVSTLLGFNAPAGYGYIVSNTVIPTSDKTWIPGGTGFFNASIPAYEGEEGTAFIPTEGIISGEGTAVENATIVKNVANDVYTVSGVKVRSNVKASVATKGLPKGIYIVGGKKVIVK